MYAVIETGGKQYRVKEGDIIRVEKLNVEAGEKITFDRVLMAGDGAELQIGQPYVDTKVFGEVIENGKAKKVIIFKYKAKKDYRKKQGHRQPYSLVQITSLTGEMKKAEKPAEAETSEPKAEETETPEAKEKKVSASMKKDELIAYAKEHNIEIDEKATKAVIIETIENAQ